MAISRSYYKKLLVSFINDELEADEIQMLYSFIESDPEGYEALMNDPQITALAEVRSRFLSNSLTDEIDNRLRQRILAYPDSGSYVEDVDAKVLHKRLKFKRTWYLVAAAMILLFGIGIYFYLASGKQQPSIVATLQEEILAPSSSFAVITLYDGSKVLIDSLKNGQATKHGNIIIKKNNSGQISYEVIGGPNKLGKKYNTLMNPRGSKVIDIILSDGTHVWLNAGSSMKYPVEFEGNERLVELKGEGYFEVAKDPHRKFIVKSDKVQTEVLGTHFNVNGFEDETAKVTLLEGAIKITSVKTGGFKVLEPGEQAEVGNAIHFNNVDVNNVIAWKDGYFSLDGLSFPEFMRQLERWYNIDVIYLNGDPNIHLFGKLGHDLTLPEIVSSLKDMGVNCKIKGSKLYIQN